MTGRLAWRSPTNLREENEVKRTRPVQFSCQVPECSGTVSPLGKYHFPWERPWAGVKCDACGEQPSKEAIATLGWRLEETELPLVDDDGSAAV